MEQNNEMIESTELSPEELASVAGGGPTQNRYDAKICSRIREPSVRCDGHWDLGMWCDHFSKESTTTGRFESQVHYVCGMGRFDMVVTLENNTRD